MEILIYFGGGDELGWSSLPHETFPRWLQAVEPTSDFLGVRPLQVEPSPLQPLSGLSLEAKLVAEFSPEDAPGFSLDFLGTQDPPQLREWLLREGVYETSELLESVVLSGQGEKEMRWVSIFDFQEGSILVAPGGGAGARAIEEDVLRESAWQSSQSKLQFVRATLSAAHLV